MPLNPGGLVVIDPARLKPYMSHEDRFLRRAASRFFADQWSQDPELLPLLIDACRRYPDTYASWNLSDGLHYRVTETGLNAVLDWLPTCAHSFDQDNLNGILLNTPVELWDARQQVIRATANVDPEVIARLERRYALASRPAASLWQELQDLAPQFEQADEDEDLETDKADDLIVALARHAVPDEATLGRMLHDLRDDEGWLPLFLTDLAGLRRCRAAVPPLVGYLEIDTDLLREKVVTALSRIGDVTAVRLIREQYPNWSEHSHSYAGETLEHLKHAETEDAVLALLSTEKDRTYRTFLCSALCGVFAERGGIEAVRQEVRRGYDRSMLHLEDQLLPVLDILGIDIPEAKAWRLRREEHERKNEKIFQLLEATSSDEAPDLPPLPERTDHEIPKPFQRTEARVGRNDPCPCGSGKKYKKCCGR
jgi:hypothetical protein